MPTLTVAVLIVVVAAFAAFAVGLAWADRQTGKRWLGNRSTAGALRHRPF